MEVLMPLHIVEGRWRIVHDGGIRRKTQARGGEIRRRLINCHAHAFNFRHVSCLRARSKTQSLTWHNSTGSIPYVALSGERLRPLALTAKRRNCLFLCDLRHIVGRGHCSQCAREIKGQKFCLNATKLANSMRPLKL
ncbi:hypothetical protein SUGI_0789180 [Cryptomeria japonica]|nr:hypothetical protein SUGI_0789180 [Cryptomeria japonica]